VGGATPLAFALESSPTRGVLRVPAKLGERKSTVRGTERADVWLRLFRANARRRPKMRTLSNFAIVGSLLAASSTLAAAQESFQGDRPTISPPPAAPTPDVKAKTEALPRKTDPSTARPQLPTNEERSPRGDRWRYVWHNAQWWYWLPSNRWAYWTGYRWAPYTPQSNATSYVPRVDPYAIRRDNPTYVDEENPAGPYFDEGGFRYPTFYRGSPPVRGLRPSYAGPRTYDEYYYAPRGREYPQSNIYGRPSYYRYSWY
jgi:hypothetical protein